MIDTVIEDVVVPSLSRKQMPTIDSLLAYASNLEERQIKFGLAQRFREPGMSKDKAGREYAAFFEVEHNGGLDKKALAIAKQEIETSLKNLLSCASLIEKLIGARWIGAQRTLSFNLDGNISVRAHPDLIAFFENQAPLIIDWKSLSPVTSSSCTGRRGWPKTGT